MPEMPPRQMQVCCIDCGRKYGDECGFPDLVVPNDVWAKISPTGHEGGLLCPSCMCRRAHDAGLENISAVFRSGPFAVAPIVQTSKARLAELADELAAKLDQFKASASREIDAEKAAGQGVMMELRKTLAAEERQIITQFFWDRVRPEVLEKSTRETKSMSDVREALKPFADAAALFDNSRRGTYRDAHPVIAGLTVKDFRQARTALSTPQQPGAYDREAVSASFEAGLEHSANALSKAPQQPGAVGGDGWAVVDRGRVLVRTVSDTRRAGVVNWLCTEAKFLATIFTTDEQIEQAWQAKHGAAEVIPVFIAVAPQPPRVTEEEIARVINVARYPDDRMPR